MFTTDTGMATVWLSRFVRMTGARRLIGSYNLGSMANAMPQALGAAALDRDRQVVAFCGDGGLSMLMGDLITAVTYELPVKLVVFDNGRLGMVKLEMEQVGLPEYGTELQQPGLRRGRPVDRAARRPGHRPATTWTRRCATRWPIRGRCCSTCSPTPTRWPCRRRPTLAQGWGFAIAKSKEFLESHGG